MAHVYKEKTVHLAAIGWIKEHWNYQELHSDEEATGARMDSVGLLDGKIIAIEVKPRIYGGMSFFKDGKSGSLESKIGDTLKKLRGGERGTQIDLIRSHWDGSPLNIAILTASLTEAGYGELAAMLACRALEWGFRYRVLLWDGEQIDVRTIGPLADELEARTFDSAFIPILTGKSNRSPAKSFDAWYGFTKDLGLGDTLPKMISEAKFWGFKLQRNGGCISLSRGDLIAGKTVVTIFVANANPKDGFNVGVNAGLLGITSATLPGKVAPRAGFLNTNLYIKNCSEFSTLLALLDDGKRIQS